MRQNAETPPTKYERRADTSQYAAHYSQTFRTKNVETHLIVALFLLNLASAKILNLCDFVLL